MLETVTYYLWNYCAVKIKVCSVLLRNLGTQDKQHFSVQIQLFNGANTLVNITSCALKFFFPPNFSQVFLTSLIISSADTSLQFSIYAVCLTGVVEQSTAIQDVSPVIRWFKTVHMTYVLPIPTDILFCFTAALPDFISLPLTIVFVVWVYC